MAATSQYSSGDVVWVKCGQLFWPAQVHDFTSLPDDVQEDFNGKRLPTITAKFFDEDGYEFLFDTKNLYPYNCGKKEEFIRKGIVRSRTKIKEGVKDGWFAKFPMDVVKSEELTGGDPQILEKDPFIERNEPRINYKEFFGIQKNDKKIKKTKSFDKSLIVGGKRKSNQCTSAEASPKMKKTGQSPFPRPIVHPRFLAGGSDHQVKILPQPSTPYHLDLQMKQEKVVSSNAYVCHVCGFSATRLNVIVLHQKSHSEPTRNNSTLPVQSGSRSTNSKARLSPNRKKRPAANVALDARTQSQKRNNTSSNVASSSTSKRRSATLGKTMEKTPKRRSKTTDASIHGTNKGLPDVVPCTNLVASPVASNRKRITKKQKREREKKMEERNLILHDWGDDEEEEETKSKIINDVVDKSSDEDSGRDAFLGDDNIHGYYDDDDDDDTEERTEKKVEVGGKEDEGMESAKTEKQDEAVMPGKKEEPEKPSDTSPKDGGLLTDIGKLLQETKVPDVQSAEGIGTFKKSVEFSEDLIKEMQQKKFALMEHPSNLDIPEEVEDEFSVSFEPEMKAAARPILKSASQLSQKSNSPSQKQKANLEISAEGTNNQVEGKTKEETVSFISTLGSSGIDDSRLVSEGPSNSDSTLSEGGQQVVLQNSTGVSTVPVEGDHQDTYIFLVDENSSQVMDSLNNQYLYFDSNSLANGNVVLVSEDAADAATSEDRISATTTGPIMMASTGNNDDAVVEITSKPQNQVSSNVAALPETDT